MLRTACVLAALLMATPVPAAEEPDEHAGHHPPATADAEAPGQGDRSDAAAQLQEGMQAMQELMAKIRTATDPDEKERLLAAHMLAMQAQIKAIRALYAGSGGHAHAAAGEGKEGREDGMMGKDGGMMGQEGGMMDKDGGMMGKDGGMMRGGMMMRNMHEQMEQRMNAVEQLLEQFIEHEAVDDADDDD